MVERVKLRKRPRVRLRADSSEISPPIPVVVSGTGSAVGTVLVGHAVRKTKEYIAIRLTDEDGEWIEKYDPKTGIRFGDGEGKSGWKIAIDDLAVKHEEEVRRLPAKVKCLFAERVRTGPKTEAVYEVWLEVESQTHFFKAYSEEENEKGVKKQRVRLVPFSIMKKMVADFCVKWD